MQKRLTWPRSHTTTRSRAAASTFYSPFRTAAHSTSPSVDHIWIVLATHHAVWADLPSSLQLVPARSSSQKLAERGEAGSGAESLAAGHSRGSMGRSWCRIRS